jgi:hypothetical protein
MAQMAEPAVAEGEDDLGAVQPPLGRVPAGATSDLPCHLKLRSESVPRGAGCGKSASPDLWGARSGNRPGLPDSGGPDPRSAYTDDVTPAAASRSGRGATCLLGSEEDGVQGRIAGPHQARGTYPGTRPRCVRDARAKWRPGRAAHGLAAGAKREPGRRPSPSRLRHARELRPGPAG